MKKYIFGFLFIGTFVTYVGYVQLNGGLEQKTVAAIIAPSPTPAPPTPPAPSFFEDDDDVQPLPAAKPVVVPAPAATQSKTVLYKNGTFTGPVVDVYYGNVQVQAIITNGKITDVQFLDHPQSQDRSIKINTYAMPLLRQEAISAQQAIVDTVSGATATSGGFTTSLAGALAKAKI